MKICVVGAGVIGLTTARALLRRGHQVILVDAAARAGQGCSFANGAQLSYSYVAPLADASLWAHLPAYLLGRDSPLSWRPRLELAQWRWIAAFLRACNGAAARRASADLLALAFFSRDQLALLQRDLALDFDFRTAGKLVLLSGAGALAAASRQVDWQRRHGCQQQVLGRDACIEIEPALAPSARRWSGAVHTPSEQVGDCLAFCQGLEAALALRHSSLRRVFSSVATGAVIRDGRVRALRCAGADIEADYFVLANGVGSVALAASMGVALPIYPLKGYSLTFPAGGGAGIPSVSVTDLAKKIVYARLGARLRVAGRVEIGSADALPDERRWRALAREARALFPALDGDDGALAPWAGLRPATPSGVPIIGRGPLPNLFINAGHGALGWTLACGSAELLAGDIDGDAAVAGIARAPFAWRAGR